MPITNVHMLGTFAVVQSGREVTSFGLKEKALIAFLCASKGRHFRRAYLADLLWERATENKAKHSLSQALYTIRRSFPNLLVSQRDTVGCNEDCTRTDIEQFSEHLAAGDLLSCVSFLKGPFLDNLAVIDVPAFEDWRQSFGRNLFLRFQERLTDKLREMPANQRRSILAEFPISAFEVFPGLADFQKDGGHREPGVGPARASADVNADAVRTPFVGREVQLRTLQQLWAECQTSGPQFAIVTGNPGFGKTRLLMEFAERLSASGATTLWTSCYEAERAIDFGPISDLLTRSLDLPTVNGLESIWLAALSQIVPAVPITAEVPPALSASASQCRLYEAVLRLFEHMSIASPVVLLIDDVQWCDRSSRALLSYLSRRTRGKRILIVAAMRSGHGVPSPLPPWTSWHQIRVEEFTPGNLSDLVDSHKQTYGSKFPGLDKLARLTAGHPYLVSELVRLSARKGWTGKVLREAKQIPEAIDYFLRSLLDGLSVGAQNVLAVLAVIGKPTSAELIRRVAQRKSAAKALDDLAARGIIAVGQQRVKFRHDLVREAAYMRIPVLTRIDLHRRAAQILSRSCGQSGETAEHFYKARIRTLAYRYAVRAVREADERSAPHESVHYLRLALKAAPHKELQLRPLLAERLYRANRFAQARRELEAVLVKQPSFPPRRSFLRYSVFDLELGYALGQITGPVLRERLALLIREIGSDNPDVRHRAIRLQLRSALNDGAIRVAAGGISELREFGIRNADQLKADGIESLTLAVLAHSHFFSAGEAEVWSLPLLRSCDDIANHELRIRVLSVLGIIAYENGQLKRAHALARRALEEVNAVGAISLWPIIASHIHMLLVEQGNFVEASALAAEMRRRVRSVDGVQVLGILCANEGVMFHEMGKFGEAIRVMHEALQYLSRFDVVWPRIGILGLSGMIAFEQGDLAKARMLGDEAKSRLDQLGMRASDVSSAEILIARLEATLHHRTTAVARLRTAIEDYRERDLLCRLKMQLELARLLKPVDRQSARREATQVYEVARSIEARPLAERADSFLHRF